MRAFGSNDLNRLIREKKGDREQIVPAVREIVAREPVAVLKVDRLRAYLMAEEVRAAIVTLFASARPELYLPHLKDIRDFFPDEELRERLIAIHRTHPWVFYINAPMLHPLFPNEFFRRLLDQGRNFFVEDDLFRIFLLWNAEMPLMSYNEEMQAGLRSRMDTTEEAEVYLESPREPGFACGGMDKNFHEAAKNREGLCLVNGAFLAKHYHTKGPDKARKVTYVSQRSRPTTQGYAIWSDYIYAPSDGQHEAVVAAIDEERREIEIPHFTIRPVRPLIETTSKSLFALFNRTVTDA